MILEFIIATVIFFLLGVSFGFLIEWKSWTVLVLVVFFGINVFLNIAEGGSAALDVNVFIFLWNIFVMWKGSYLGEYAFKRIFR